MRAVRVKRELLQLGLSDGSKLYYTPLVSQIYYWKRLDTVLRLAKIKGHEKVLELGTGSGILLPSLSKLAKKVFAVDPNSKPNQINRIIKAYNCKNTTFKKTYLKDIKEKFDVIIAISVLEHIKDVDRIINKFHSLLNKNGRLIISQPTENHWYKLGRALTTRRNPGHYWSAEQVVSRVSKKFNLDKKVKLPFPLFDLAWVCSFKKK